MGKTGAISGAESYTLGCGKFERLLREQFSDAKAQATAVAFLRVGKVIHVNTVIGAHLVLHGYGHWLSNDPRGSGSSEGRAAKFADLGPVHFGRKQVQPSRDELRAFHAEAGQRLEYPLLWFKQPARGEIASTFARVCEEHRYTAWACAVLQNHAHLLIRTHRDRSEVMWEHFAVAARDALWDAGVADRGHPVWSNRPYVVYKTSVASVRTCVKYIEDNPRKHKLPAQVYPWVSAYDGFPFHKKRK